MLSHVPDLSKIDLTDPNWIAAILAIVVAICAAAYKAIPWIWKHTRYKIHNFRLAFLNRLPIPEHPDGCVEEPASLKVLACGQHILCLKAQSACGFKVKKVNVRFLTQHSGGIIGRDVVSVQDLEEPYQLLNQSFRIQDATCGIDLEFTNAVTLARGAALYFTLTLLGHQNWNGVLSFRAEDDTGFRSFARYAVEFRKS